MTRGNQREIDRQRAANRHKKDGAGDKREGNPQQRNEKDAAALAAKLAKKQAAAAENSGGGGKKQWSTDTRNMNGETMRKII